MCLMHIIFTYFLASSKAYRFNTLDKIIVGNTYLPNLVASRSKVWVCDRLLAGIADSNPAGYMDVCLL